MISNNRSFISQNLTVMKPLGGKFNLYSPSGFEIKSDLYYRTSKFMFYFVRALKCYLNEKNLMHGRVTSMISKFSPQIFETYFKCRPSGKCACIRINLKKFLPVTSSNICGTYATFYIFALGHSGLNSLSKKLNPIWYGV